MLPMKAIREFFKLEASAGILLVISAIIALIWENSPLEGLYDLILTTPVAISVGNFAIHKSLLLWINDGLMAFFFLLVGLEIKREILEGQLSSRDQMMLPTIAAFGGFVCPAIVYTLFNFHDAAAIRGWAIPAATDIAFALGVLNLLGKQVPESLKIILVALAILDDIAAIFVIAVFYTSNISLVSLLLSVAGLLMLFVLNRKNVSTIVPYAITGIFLWVCVLKSGVHATLAGVTVGLFIPLNSKDSSFSPLKRLEHNLHPWVAYGILPIFAFFNAGVPISGLSMSIFHNSIVIGIMLGLLVGAPAGVMLFSGVGYLLRICRIPRDVSWSQYFGMAMLTGIGFTMSLFIGALAFQDVDRQNATRIAVLFASTLAGLLGSGVLYWHGKTAKT